MRLKLVLVAILLCPISAHAITYPTAPSSTMSRTIPAANGGTTATASSCANLKTLLDSAAAADLTKNHFIIVPVSLTCGPVFLPSHSGASGGWIVVQSQNAASLPASGTRVGLSDASNMPIFQYNSGTNPYTSCGDEVAMTMSTGAQNYYVDGIKFVANASFIPTYALIVSGYGICNYTSTKNLVLSRSLMVNSDLTCCANHDALERAVLGDMDLGGLGIFDSYCAGVRDHSLDTQCFLSISNPGPVTWDNNYIEAAGENIMLGGGEPIDSAHMISNVTITHNFFEHNPSYLTGSNYWQIKSLLELKLGNKVLIEGNIFKGAWAGTLADSGHAFRFTPRSWGSNVTCYPSPNTLCPQTYASVNDVTFRYNWIEKIGGGFTIISSDDGGGGNSQGIARLHIHDNVWFNIGDPYDPTCNNSAGTWFDWNGGGPYPASDVLIEHETFYSATSCHGRLINFQSLAIGAAGVGPSAPTKTADSNFVVRDNIVRAGSAVISASGARANGPATLDAAFTTGALPNGYQWTNNAIYQLAADYIALGGSLGDNIAGSRFVNNCWGSNGSKDSTTDLTYSNIGFASASNTSTNPAADFLLTSGAFRAGQACESTDHKAMGVDWTAWAAVQAGGSGSGGSATYTFGIGGTSGIGGKASFH